MADLQQPEQIQVECPLLPPVTMVFATVQGGKDLVRKKQPVAQLVHSVMQKVMQVGLHQRSCSSTNLSEPVHHDTWVDGFAQPYDAVSSKYTSCSSTASAAAVEHPASGQRHRVGKPAVCWWQSCQDACWHGLRLLIPCFPPPIRPCCWPCLMGICA